jgi:pimeloyl-ACP methyl ester carboxylesterase
MSTHDLHATQAKTQGHYAPVNGLSLYYEIHGSGQPLVLLHGGFGLVGMFAQLLPALAQTRQVIAVEMQGHGHTADIQRPFSFEALADDVAALIEYLGLERADVCGYSMGGGVALQTAIRHPQVVRKLVLISSPCKRQGWYSADLAGMESISVENMSKYFIHDVYRSVAPKPDDWPALVNKTRQLLGRENPYDWSAQVAHMQTPTLIVVGDQDGVRLDHAVEMLGLLRSAQPAQPIQNANDSAQPASQLAILPGVNHFTSITRTDLLLPIITPFLDANP